MRLVVKHQRVYSQEVADFSRQLGIRCIQLTSPDFLGDECFELDKLLAIRRRVEENGQQLVMIENVPATMSYRFVCGLEGRDRQLEAYRRTIRNMGKAGVPLLGMHFMPNRVWRTCWNAPARGGATAPAFDEEQMGRGNQDIFTRSVLQGVQVDRYPSPDELWENFRYFLSAVLEEAERSDVRIALHPDDPPLPKVGGVSRIFYSADRLLRAVAEAGSPAFGLNLCLGTMGTMKNAHEEIPRVIRALAPEKKIFSVHFRGVQGTVPAFRECFLDECDIDPVRMLRWLRDAGYDGYVMDDHYPHMIGDDELGLRARAYSIGFIRGMLRQ